MNKADRLESAMRDLTQPINGQYPRPWMTSSKDPASSRVFVVGINQATAFTVQDFRSHDEFMDALYNRGPETLKDAYNRIRKNGPFVLGRRSMISLIS